MSKKLLLFVVAIFTLINANSQVIQKGAVAPDFKLYALDGSINTLDSYKDKVVVVKMWFTTCAPCIQEMPRVNKLVAKYKTRNDIVFIAPSPNSKKTLKKFMRKVDFDYTVMSGSYEMLKKYNPIRRYPTHVVIDKKGKISFILEGSSSDIDAILDAEIAKVL